MNWWSSGPALVSRSPVGLPEIIPRDINLLATSVVVYQSISDLRLGNGPKQPNKHPKLTQNGGNCKQVEIRNNLSKSGIKLWTKKLICPSPLLQDTELGAARVALAALQQKSIRRLASIKEASSRLSAQRTELENAPTAAPEEASESDPTCVEFQGRPEGTSFFGQSCRLSRFQVSIRVPNMHTIFLQYTDDMTHTLSTESKRVGKGWAFYQRSHSVLLSLKENQWLRMELVYRNCKFRQHTSWTAFSNERVWFHITGSWLQTLRDALRFSCWQFWTFWTNILLLCGLSVESLIKINKCTHNCHRLWRTLVWWRGFWVTRKLDAGVYFRIIPQSLTKRRVLRGNSNRSAVSSDR